MAFSVQINTMPGEIVVHIDGSLDEHAELPKISAANTIRVNLQQMLYVNSIGVRKWIRWLQDLSEAGLIVLEYCPVIFVKNLSSIKGMFGKNTRVDSFYVPYYNDVSEERKNVLYTRDKDFFSDGRIVLPKNIPQGMEIDVIEDIYFSFLKR